MFVSFFNRKKRKFKLRYLKYILKISINRDYWPNIRSFYNQKKPEFSNNNNKQHNTFNAKNQGQTQKIELSIIINIFKRT